MGKIVFNNLPKSINEGRSYYYADLHLDLEEKYTIKNDFNQKPEINDLKLDYDVNAIANSLRNLFTTTPGDKILNPEYGLDLRKYLFEPATVEIANSIRGEIYTQVSIYEPRVKLTSVNITILEDVNEYDITIYMDIPALNINNVSFFGTLNSNGYIFRS
jgi:phage baseplate assembly protein W